MLDAFKVDKAYDQDKHAPAEGSEGEKWKLESVKVCLFTEKRSKSRKVQLPLRALKKKSTNSSTTIFPTLLNLYFKHST